MKVVSIVDFVKNALSYLDLVEKGVELEIQLQGKVVAKLLPPGAPHELAWRKPGLELACGAPSLSQAIIKDRR